MIHYLLFLTFQFSSPLPLSFTQKMHLNYVRHSRLTTLSSLPIIVFMRNCMVEMFGLFPTLSYQLIFVYTRQLAQQLRTAYSTGGGNIKVGTWPYMHSLELFVASLCEIPEATLRLLLLPIVQVLLGTAQLLSSAQFTPLRLHVVRLLVELANKTGVFIPTAPLLLEVCRQTQSVSHSSTIRFPTIFSTLHALLWRNYCMPKCFSDGFP